MSLLELNFDYMDWILVRQSLALSLAHNSPVRIKKAGAFLDDSPHYGPLFSDLAGATRGLSCGELARESSDIIFKPALLQRSTCGLESGKFSSSIELLLFFLPALFKKDFRTVLNISGVTHSPLSYPTAFIKETLYPALERAGLFASLSLKRFGFYGSGGGRIEARAYPAEDGGGMFRLSDVRSVEGIRVFISGIGTELAMKEKVELCRVLNLAENKSSIMEIRDADGFGNCLHVYVKYGEDTLVLFRDMPIYNDAGDFIFDEDVYVETMGGIVKETRDLIDKNLIPGYMIREMLLYFPVPPADYSHFTGRSGLEATASLCKIFRGTLC